jgi:nitrogen fixation NifU-like protein
VLTEPFDFGELDDLYREVILDHYRSPRNRHTLESVDIEAHGFNPFCGDEVVLQLKLDEAGQIDKISQGGQGCSISQASASILSDLIRGKTLEEGEKLSGAFREMMRGQELSNEQLDAMGDLEALQGVRKFPIRIKCALLPWAALDDGVAEYRSRSSEAN